MYRNVLMIALLTAIYVKLNLAVFAIKKVFKLASESRQDEKQ